MKLHKFIIAVGIYIFSITAFSAGMDIHSQRAMIASQIMQTQQQLSQKHRDVETLKIKIKDLNTAIGANAMRSTQLILLKTQKAKAQNDLNSSQLQIQQLTKNQNDLFEIQKTITGNKKGTL